MSDVTDQGIPSTNRLPYAPDMARRIKASIEWNNALLAHRFNGGPDPGPRPYTLAPDTCEVCGDKHHSKGWCRRHYRMVRDRLDPFVDPTPSKGRVGRPRAAHTSDRNYMIRISSAVIVELDSRLEGSRESRTKAIDTILRAFLEMPALVEQENT